MADTDQQETDILKHLEDLILSGTRCFESEDADCQGVLVDLRQGLRSLSLLELRPDNYNIIEDTLTTLIDQLEIKLQRVREAAHDSSFTAPRRRSLGIYNIVFRNS